MALQNDPTFRLNTIAALRDAAQHGHADKVAETMQRQSWLLGQPAALYLAMESATRGGHNAVIKAFIEHGVDINLQNELEQTVLHVAASMGDVGSVIFLVDRGADIQAQDTNGNTPLYFSALVGAIDCAKKLVDLGADAGIRGPGGRTPIEAARNQQNHGFADELATHIALRQERRTKHAYTARNGRPAP